MFVAITGQLFPATISWNDIGTSWTTDANWTGGVAPVNDLTTDLASFGNATINNQPNLTGNRSVAGIVFANGAGAFTIAGTSSPVLTIGSGGIDNQSTATQTVASSLSLALGAATTFQATSSGALSLASAVNNGGFLLTLAGSSSGNGTLTGIVSGSGGLTKSGANTWTLSGANTYTGATTVSAGTLRATSSAAALGAGTLALSGGSLVLANDTALAFNRNTTVSADATVTSDRLTPGAGVTHTLGTLSIGANTLSVTRGASATSGTGGLTFGATTLTGDAIFAPAANALLTLGAVGQSGGARSLTMSGAGTLTLVATTGTYAGATTINSGTVNAAVLANGGVTSSIGNSTNAAGNLVLNAGTLNYTGAAASTDRLFTVGTGGATLSTSGTGALNFTATGSLTLSGTDTARSFTLGGSSAFANAFSPVIGDNGTGATSLTKTGAGTWILNSANTYTGATTVSSGALLLGASGAISTANLSLAATTTGNALFGGQGTFSRGFGPGAGAVQLNGFSATVGAGFAAYGGALTVTPGNATWGSTTGFFSTTTGPLVFNNTISNNTVTWTSDINLGGTARTFNVADNTATAADYAIISGVISGTGGLTKSGAGTLVLTGANTYTGATSVTGGTLALSGSGAIPSDNLALNTGGVFATSGTFSRGFGSSAGQVALSSTGGAGFAAYGGALNVTPGAATWGTTPGFFSASTGPLIFGSVNADNVVTWTSDLNLGGTARIITANDNISTTADYAVISGVVSGTAATLTKNGTGRLDLTGANTYTGQTLISAGTLTIDSLANVSGGASSLGAPTTAANGTIAIGATTVAGTLAYVGTGHTTNRVVNLAGTTGGATLDASGSGALVFTSNFTATGAGAKTLTLTGTSTATNDIQGAIVNSSSATAVTKTGTGTWQLSGPNTYTGATTVNNGTLRLGSAGALPNIALTVATNTAGGTALLDLNNYNATVASLSLGGAGSASASSVANITTSDGTLTLGGNVTFTSTGNPLGSTISGKLALGAADRTFTINDSTTAVTDLSVSAVVSGTGGLVKAGAGTLLLDAANTYSGNTTLTAGTLVAGDTAALGTGTLIFNGGTFATDADRTLTNPLTLAASSTIGGSAALTLSGNLDLGTTTRTLTVSNSAATTLSGVLSNTAGLTKAGAGTLVLSNTNTYTGVTTLSAGTLRATTSAQALGTGASTLSLGGGTLSLANDTGLAFARNTTVTAATVLESDRLTSGAGVTHSLGTLSQGTATLTLNPGANVASDTAGLTFGATTLTGNPTYLTAANTQLTLGAVTGGATARTITKTGAGTLLLDAAAGTFTTASSLVVNHGTVRFGANNPIGATALTNVTVNATTADATALLDLNGFSQSILALTFGGAGGTNTSTSNLSTGAGTLTLGGNVTYTATGDPLGSTLSGLVNLGGATRTFTVGNSNSAATDLTVSAGISGTGGLTKAGLGVLLLSGTNSYSGATTINTGTLRLGSSTSLPNTAVTVNATTASTTAALDLAGFNTTVPSLTLGGTGGLVGSINNVSTGAGTLTLGGTLTTTATGNPTNPWTVSGKLDLGGTARTFSIADSTGITGTAAELAVTADIAGTAGLTKTGAGLLLLSGTNTYSGVTTATTGPLRAASVAAFGTSTLALNGGSLQLAGDSNLAFGNNTTVAAATTITSDRVTSGAGVTHSLGTLSLGAFTLTTAAGANVASGTAGLTFGTTTLTGAGTFSAGAGTLLTLGSLTGTFNSTFTGAGDSAVTGAVTTGTGTLTKSGAGTLTLSGANTYTGVTTVSAGVLNLRHNTALGTAAAGTTVTSGAALELQGDITIASEALTLNGSGIATNGALRNISGNNAYNGAVTLGSATNIQSDTGTLTLGGNISGATFGLTFDGTGDTTASGIIGTTSGTLAKSGTGTLTLTGANTYTGATTVSAGVLNLRHNTALGTTAGGVTVASGAALELQGGITIGAEALSLSGDGVSSNGALRNISGTNAYNGAITLGAASRIQSDAGTLTLSAALGGAGQNLTVAGAGDTTIAAAIGTTTGSLTKSGAGTLTLSAANTFTGGATLSDGTLTIGAAGSLAAANTLTVDAGTLNLNNNQTVAALSGTGGTINFGTSRILTLNQITSTSYAGILAGDGGLTLAGAGSMSLSGGSSNSYTGPTTVTAGTLTLAKTGGATAIAGGTITVGDGSGTDILRLGGSGQIGATVPLILSGGRFELQNHSASLGTLGLGSSSVIDFGSTAAALAFADSSLTSWTGTLTIYNYTVGANTLRFGSSASGLSGGQLAQISFDGYAGAATINANGYVSPVPEPSEVAAAAGLVALALAAYTRRRRRLLARGSLEEHRR